jgi:hypothetical protein
VTLEYYCSAVLFFVVVGIPLLGGFCAFILYPIYCMIKRTTKNNNSSDLIDIKKVIYEDALKYNYSNDAPDKYFNLYKDKDNKNIKTQYCKSCGAPTNYSVCKYCGAL